MHSRGFGRASQIAPSPHLPDATFAALYDCNGSTAAETKSRLRVVRVSREGAPNPHRCGAHVCVFGLVSFGCSDQIPIFGSIRRQ